MNADFISTNLAHWENRAEEHFANPSSAYPIEEVVAGQSTLRQHELELCGEIRGARLLHLMCHIGLDSISWAREGAIVTAIDFSPRAISAAKQLSRKAGTSVRFETSELGILPGDYAGKFDRIVMTYGVLDWVPDISRLFSAISTMLAPDGRFVLVDGHPVARLLPRQHIGSRLTLAPEFYFGTGLPQLFMSDSSYGGGCTLTAQKNCRWHYSLSEILNSAIEANMKIEKMLEFPYHFYRKYDGMRRLPNGYFAMPESFPCGFPLLLAASFEKI